MTISDERPNNARMVDYVLGGSHHFAVDRQATDAVRHIFPEGSELVRAQRRFLQRAVAWMAEERGIRSFLDFGSGLPTNGNVHEVVLDYHDDAQVVYCDIDPITVTYSKNLLRSTPNVQYIQENITHIEPLLARSEVAALRTRPNAQPVGITLIGIGMYFPTPVTTTVLQALYNWAPSGSALALVLSHPSTADHKGMQLYQKQGFPMFWQTLEEVQSILGSWNVTEEGIVRGLGWRHETDSQIPGAHMNWALVATK